MTVTRRWIKSEAKSLGIKPSDLLAMSSKRDPFFMGTKGQITRAKWATQLYQNFREATGEEAVHSRGLHYFVFMKMDEVKPPSPSCTWSAYDNTKTCWKYLADSLIFARRLGFMPWRAIIDEKNTVLKVTEYGAHSTNYSLYRPRSPVVLPTPDELEVYIPNSYVEDYDSFERYVEREADRISRKVSQVHFDNDLLRPYHIEVWAEKRLIGRVRRVVERYADVLVEGEGELSDTIAHDFICRLNRLGKPGVALYLCDFDPKGTDMPVSMARKIEKFKVTGELQQEAFLAPIAVRKDQIRKYGLPRKYIKKSDETGTGAKAYKTLVNDWERRMDEGACELQALEAMPDLYEKAVEDALLSWRVDPEELENEKKKLIDSVKKEIKLLVREALVEKQGELEKLFEKQKNLAQKMREVLPDEGELNEKFRGARELLDGRPDEDALSSVRRNLKAPRVSPPEIDLKPPNPVLLDTRQSYGEQLLSYRTWQSEGELKEDD